MSKNYWAILELTPGSSPEEIKKARDRLAKKYHPDRNRGKEEWAKEKFQEVQEAYEILTGKRNPPGSGGGGGNNGPRYDTCDYCQQKYDFDRENYPKWKEFRKKNGEREGFHFCNRKGAECYNNFFFCSVCENKRTKDNCKVSNEWKKKRGQNIFFCSDACQKNFNQGGGSDDHNDPFDEQDNSKCDQCGGDFQRNEKGVKIKWYIGRDENRWYCSEKCAREYLNQQNQSEQDEKENASESPLTNPITSRGEDETNNNSGDNSRPNHGSHNNIPNQNEEDNSPDMSKLTLVESQAQAEQEIEKLLKENNISEQELNQEKLLAGTDWKTYLKKLDTPQKVAEFVKKVQAFAFKKKTSKLTPTGNKDPHHKWILPVSILVVSLLALTSLGLIMRKRSQRRF